MAVDHNNPQSRDEEILIATIDGNEYTKAPQSRMEELLLELKEVIEEGGGGTGGIIPVGVTTTPLTDGASTNPILINGEEYTAVTGDMVTYQDKEFLFNVNEVWQELGDVSYVMSIIDDILNGTTIDSFADVETALAGKQDTLAAGKYISIDANDEIKVDRVIPNEAFNYVLQQTADYTLKVTKFVNNVAVSEETYGPPTTWDAPVEVTLDEAIDIYINLVGTMYYELLIASDSHEAGFKQTMSWFGRNTYTENFSTVDHTGEKLIIKSELDTAINAIKDGQSIDSFADVETALAGKQGTLTAGEYIDITSGEISVEREIPNETASYELKTTSTSDPNIVTQVIKTSNGSVVWTMDYNYADVRDNPVTIDNTFTLSYTSGKWKYELLVASDDHSVGYYQEWNWSAWVDYTENFTSVDNTGKKLIIKSEMDTALALKQPVTDNNLTTTDKTTTGAINELKSGLTNVHDNFTDVIGWDKRKNLVFKTIEGTTVNDSGEIVTNATYNLFVAKVVSGETYTATKGGDYEVYAFYATEPVIGSVSYNNSRTTTADHENTYSFTAPINGYVVFRGLADFASAQLEKGTTATSYEPYHPVIGSAVEELQSGLTTLNSKIILSGVASNIGVWTNDSFAQIAITGVTKQFTITIQNDGTLVGGVTDIT